MGIVIDSSILIACERGRFDLPGFYRAHATDFFYLTAITASELLHGVERANTPERKFKRQAFVEATLRRIPALAFDLPVARRHAEIWAVLESTGNTIGAHDMQIAATAVTHHHVIATLNRDEFARVPGLVLVDVQPFVIEK